MKKVLLGVSGSIAAYKAADIISRLKKSSVSANIDTSTDTSINTSIDISVVMTKHATEFITPLTLQVLSENPVYLNPLDEPVPGEVIHVKLPQNIDVFCLAPASANAIAKIAHGIADDQLTSMVLALPNAVPKIIAPAMNTVMYENVAVQENLNVLKSRGWRVIEPRISRLACGVEGKGALADVEEIVNAIL